MASAAWERRNAAARAKGYASYYDYRAHDFGKMAPGTPRASGEKLRRLRGHAGTGDLEKAVLSGRVEQVDVVQTGTDQFLVTVTMKDGTVRSYTIKGAKNVERFTRAVDSTQDGPTPVRVIGSPKGLAKLQAREDALEIEAAAAELGEEGDEPYNFNDDDIPF